MNIEKEVRDLIEPFITESGYKLDEVLYVLEGKTYFLRIVIDKDGFIDIEDCVNVCKLINPLLDANDLIKDAYILDVCSKEKGKE